MQSWSVYRQVRTINYDNMARWCEEKPAAVLLSIDLKRQVTLQIVGVGGA